MELFIGLGLLTFLISGGGQWVLSRRLLSDSLRSGDPTSVDQALRSWLAAVAKLNGALILGAIGYAITCHNLLHLKSPFWPMPAVGIFMGTAFGLQTTMRPIFRALRG